MAVDKEMEAVFKSSRVDPVSGNEVPVGSLPEEVRDDIPAQLSEGEYVVPADVVRYYGVKFFEDLRRDAKNGFDEMDSEGRIGGEPPMGMEMIEPEDGMMFDISELEVTEGPEEPEAAFLGKLFGKKEDKSPEDSVRERFKAAEGRDNSAKAIERRVNERRAAAIAKAMAEKDDDRGSSASFDFGFSGSPMERAERKYGGKKSKSANNPTGAGSVEGAYTPSQSEPTFAEQINFGGDYAEGGMVDDGGRLGLGSEGIGLSGSGMGEVLYVLK